MIGAKEPGMVPPRRIYDGLESLADKLANARTKEECDKTLRQAHMWLAKWCAAVLQTRLASPGSYELPRIVRLLTALDPKDTQTCLIARSLHISSREVNYFIRLMTTKSYLPSGVRVFWIMCQLADMFCEQTLRDHQIAHIENPIATPTQVKRKSHKKELTRAA